MHGNRPGTTYHLAMCPSPPHRGVLGLLSEAMGRETNRDTLIADLGRSDPQDLVRIAVNSFVHVVLYKAFVTAPELAQAVPADLVIYFNEMRHANLQRNRTIGAQLAEIGCIFSRAGLTGVALKGGAELLAPLHPDPAFRFLSDLDILLPEAELEQAVALLHTCGAVSQPEDEINQRGHHHLEALWHPDWPVPVELHRGFGSAAAGRILSAETVLHAARPSGRPGLAVPAPAHRLAHAVLHAQIDPPRYDQRSLSPRDLVEAQVMTTRLSEAEISLAGDCFKAGGAWAAWEAFDATRVAMFDENARFETHTAPARAWAMRAISDFGRPGRRRRARLLRLARWYARAILFEPERRRHYLRQLRRRGGLRKAVFYQKDKFRREP